MRVGVLRGLRFAVLILAGSSCGDGQSSEDKVLTSHQDLCAGAAEEHESNGERYATAIACPFVQQVENISKYGEPLPKNSVLRDASGVAIANVSHSCDVYTLGTDEKGVAVIVHREKGQVISHGTLHRGELLSEVHSPLTLPVQVH